ncbi:MAG: tRNA (uridine(54)-C5)-methyltransferase TrmA [Halieaceae bacterium]|jgi:tRNA (uracil-5-)-methyltransferase|nr:tRNA (uridine(54)-C5)-methyltransferase TrmA [Halieaceae bacterium]
MPLSAVKPEQYETLLKEKTAQAAALLAPFSPPTPEIFRSLPTGYRMRAEFRMWHDGDQLDYVMYRREAPGKPIPISEFPIANASIVSLMPKLVERLKTNMDLRRKLFQLEFLSTLAGETLITLVYHRKLDANWQSEARQLARDLQVQIIGRSRKQKLVLERDYVTEILPVAGRSYRYRQYEQAFTQPNALVNIQMIEWACDKVASLGGDLLELYCGNGNFTLPLSRHFNQVIATELSKASIKAARENQLENTIDNIQLIRLSAEEVSQALAGERQFRRLAALPKPLNDYDLRAVFVDPPRAGLDAPTEQMVAAFDAIIYISCNPETLAKNLLSICKTHRIDSFGLFDQFPYTHHMECGVLLRRR